MVTITRDEPDSRLNVFDSKLLIIFGLLLIWTKIKADASAPAKRCANARGHRRAATGTPRSSRGGHRPVGQLTGHPAARGHCRWPDATRPVRESARA